MDKCRSPAVYPGAKKAETKKKSSDPAVEAAGHIFVHEVFGRGSLE